jgi:hypothetical protein
MRMNRWNPADNVQLTARSQYEFVPVIKAVLEELDGEADVSQIRPKIEERMRHRFTAADLRDHKLHVPKWGTTPSGLGCV